LPLAATRVVRLDQADLRRWATGLSEDDFARAVAGLGALLAEGATATRRPKLPRDHRAGIPWDIGPVLMRSGSFDGRRLARFDARILARDWAAVAVLDPIIVGGYQQGTEPPGSLEIRTASLAVGSLAWLTTLLTQTRIARGSFGAIDGIGSGPAFRYPIRVGTLRDRRSRAMHTQLVPYVETGHRWSPVVIELIEVTGPHTPVDILLVPETLNDAVSMVGGVPNGVEAGAILVLGGLGTAADWTPASIVAAFAQAVDPWAVGIADVPSAERLTWLDALIFHLTHDETLDVAIAAANATLHKGGLGVVVADPASLSAMRIQSVAVRLVDALPRVSEDRVIVPPELANALSVHTPAAIGIGRSALIEALQRPELYLHESDLAMPASQASRSIESPAVMGPMIQGAIVFDHVDTADELTRIRHEDLIAPHPSQVLGAVPTEPPASTARPGAAQGERAKPPVHSRQRGGEGTPRQGGRRAGAGRPGRREIHKPVSRRSRRRPRPTTTTPMLVQPRRDDRYIQTRITRHDAAGRIVSVARTLEPTMKHTITVWIGAPEAGARHGRSPIDLRAVIREGGTHKLRVVLAVEGVKRAAVHTVRLPETGRSSDCHFDVTAPASGRLRGRIIVQFRNRVLQTAILDAPVRAPGRSVGTWSIETEAVVREGFDDLSNRVAFDLAIVHNHNGNGDPAVTALHGDWARRFTAARLDNDVQTIQGWLSAAAEDPEPYDRLDKPATIQLLKDLALKGRDLRSQVVSDLDPYHLGDPDATPRVQVVAADPNAIFPIEFFYDFGAPTPGATLCKNSRRALQTGRCAPENHGTAKFDGSLDVVCPAGFWAMNRVIERYAVDRDGPGNVAAPDLGGDSVGVVNPVRPIARGARLGRFTGSLFAWSSIVERVDADRVTRALRAITAARTFAVQRWPTWVRRIATRQPNLLVLLAHTDADNVGTYLQIAKNANQPSGRFGRMFVRADAATIDAPPGPIVLLLGCDTARAWTEYQSWVVRFKNHGAEIVVGTIATVAAKHAAHVAQRLVGQLASARPAGRGRAGPVAFGEVLLRARQSLLADGEIMSLALTSYGDSDLPLA
jgi:hypothetical protein